VLFRIVNGELENFDFGGFLPEADRFRFARQPDIKSVAIAGIHPIFNHKNLTAEKFGKSHASAQRQKVGSDDAVAGIGSRSRNPGVAVGFIRRTGVSGNHHLHSIRPWVRGRDDIVNNGSARSHQKTIPEENVGLTQGGNSVFLGPCVMRRLCEERLRYNGQGNKKQYCQYC